MDKQRQSPSYRLTAVWLAVILALAAAWAHAQAPAPGAVISLISVSGTPKGQVMVPIMLSPQPSDTEIGSVEMEILFESKAVSFVQAEKSFLLDGAAGVFEVRQSVDPANKQSRLLVHVETKGEPRKGLPEGLILSLRFEVKADATPGTDVSLKIERLSLADISAPPKALHGTVQDEGSIEVIAPEDVPVMPCFFFTH